MDAMEGRLNADSGRQECADEAAASEFSRLFAEFAERIPHGCTRVQHREHEGVRRAALLARLDRCWTSMPTPFLSSWGARATVLDPVVGEAGLPDHAPVALRRNSKPRARLIQVSDWVARRPRFEGKVQETLAATGGYSDGTVWDRLQTHVAVMHRASEELQCELREPEPAEAALWRFHWISSLVRAARLCDWVRCSGRSGSPSAGRRPRRADGGRLSDC